MNRRQRERKLKAKRDWQAYVKARRTAGFRRFRIYDGTFSQPIYAGSFLPENMMESMSAITVEIQVNSDEFCESLQATVEAMSRVVNEELLSAWASGGTSTVSNTNPSWPMTVGELAERFRLLRLARGMSPVRIDPHNPETRLVYNGEPAYRDDMPGMTLDEFQAWSDQLIREVQGECDVTD